MKKIIPFKKDLFFNNNIYEITSISLEHTLSRKGEYLISGDFILTGEYKVSVDSMYEEKFEFKVPCDINIDDKYDMEHVIIDIDDFYYEVKESNALSISIDVLLDKLDERCIDKEDNFIDKTINKVDNVLEKVQSKIDSTTSFTEKLSDKIENIQEKLKGYVTYRVCIVKENDTLEKITDRYKIDKDTLSIYNNIADIKVGDKLIIPSNE